MASRTPGISSEQLTTVTAQNRTKELGLPERMREVVQVDVVFLCIHGVPSQVRPADCDRFRRPRNDVNWLGKYSAFTAA